MKKEPQDLTTQKVIERLAAKYPSPQYGFITQVRSGTGYYQARTADALAMSLWPSRGLHLLGFEVKVSRTDWIKELKNPEKAEELASYTHFWYMVLGNENIIKPGELPPKWGLIVPSGKGLKIVKEAPFNTETLPLDYMLMAGIFRNIAEQCIAKEVLKSKFESEYERGKDWAKDDNERLTRDMKTLRDSIEEFEKVSGVRLTEWGGNKNIGQAVNDVLSGRDKKSKENLARLLTKAKNIVKFLEGEDINNWDMS